MTWKQALGRIVPVCILLVGCSMGNPSTAVDRGTLDKGQGIELYQLVNVDAQGRAEFGSYSTVTGSNPKVPHIAVAPGQKFGGRLETKDNVTIYDYTLESTDAAKQQATILAKVTTTSK